MRCAAIDARGQLHCSVALASAHAAGARAYLAVAEDKPDKVAPAFKKHVVQVQQVERWRRLGVQRPRLEQQHGGSRALGRALPPLVHG